MRWRHGLEHGSSQLDAYGPEFWSLWFKREREREIIPILKIRKVEAKERWCRERTQGLEAGRLN